jgi:membrane-bound lytic murein transglycosylase A
LDRRQQRYYYFFRKVFELNVKKIVLAGVIFVFLVACVRTPFPVTKPEEAASPISWWKAAAPADDMAFKDIAAAARQSLEYYQKLPQDTVFFLGHDKVTALDMAVTLQNFLLIIENDSLALDRKIDRIKKDFVLYRAAGSDGGGKVLFTGYYEPTLSCRVSADDIFRYPLYRKPADIIEIDLTQFGADFPKNKIFGRLDNNKVVPYYSREEIDREKALIGKNLEILWCSDLVDIYVLQVQGSGKVELGDGNIMSVLYDGQNGRPYKSIGKYLIDIGAMTKEHMSMQGIREYLRSHPEKVNEVLDQNQSYVFFRLDTGPTLGNIGVPLTPGRSIATDSKLFPKGALGFIAAQKPVIENGMIKAWAPFTRFVMNQDTGGAIKGPGRVDLFFGQGQEAELSAGNLQHEGELYFLVRKK